MKLSVSAFRAQATAQRKILKPYQNQLNYGSCSSFPTSGIKVDEVPHMMVDKTGVGSSRPRRAAEGSHSSESSREEVEEEKKVPEEREEEPEATRAALGELSAIPEKSPGGTRTKSNQRWMKLRTTVQLSGAISNTIQKSKPPLKREDSFLKRFSTRQIQETQETVDTGDETEAANGTQSQEEVNRRRRKRRKEQSRTVVNPDENFYFYWLMTVTICVLYNLWTLIVRQSFPELQKHSSAFWYACDGFTDIIFVCDIVVQFRTGYLEQGLMVYDSQKLSKHYLKSRAFVLDVMALFPLDLIQVKIGANPILRFPRFLKIYRVYDYYYMVESRTVYPNLWRVVNLIHILLILAHWFGCFYYLLSEAEEFQGAWVYPFRQGDDATLTRKYLGSLYWSTLTLTTIGDLPTPETNAEYVFTIVSYLIGVFIFATIVGQVGNVITNRNANRLEFERLLDGAKTYMRHHKVPGGMKRRVLRWYDYSWSRGRIQGGGDINTALGLLPDKLKTELALHVNLSVLKKVTIFQECQPEFLHDLVLKMKAYIFTPGDLICRKGEIAREMFIIADGILDVISDTGRVLTTMKAGDFFGEIGILNLDGLNKRTADVRSVGYSELFSLSREDVLAAMKDYPEAQEILQNLGRKRLMEARNASKIHKSQGRQVKEREPIGESDNAGKRIVEKLRSDVKGLKNALRRSRRETHEEEEADEGHEGISSKAQERRHSVLRRMSHVHSSEESEAYEGHTPVGVGLPLLQRLKLLKEKQEKEKEERGKALTSLSRKENNDELETTNPISLRLMAVREKEDSEETNSECATANSPPARVIIQDDAIHLDATSSNDSVEQMTTMTTLSPRKKNESACRLAQDPEMPKNAKQCNQELSNQETSINVPKANGSLVHSVPKQALRVKLEVPKNREKWNILRKPARTKPEGELCTEKRSRSVSPSDDAKARMRTLGNAAERVARERRRSRSLTEGKEVVQGGNASEESGAKLPFEIMKGSDSTDEVSSEHSGLPLAKKLKILSERQRLVAAQRKNQNEAFVRSVSLDVPETNAAGDAALVRSLSIASTIHVRSEHRRVLPYGKTHEDGGSNSSTGTRSLSHHLRNVNPDDSFRCAMMDMKQRFITMGSSGSLQSPESNETIERRHLKSILKKLSAEDTNGDEGHNIKNKRRRMSLSRVGHADLKKLMRAPTLEGYAARHTKLTKSVTFDRETLPSPTEAITVETALEDATQVKGLSPTSPTAMLTLQLSNLSMIPIASPKKCEGKNEYLEDVGLSGIQEEVSQALAFADRGNLSREKVVQGISRIVQRHLETTWGNLLAQMETFRAELKIKDEAICRLKEKIEELEHAERLREEEAERRELERRRPNSNLPVEPFQTVLQESEPFHRISETDETHSPDWSSGSQKEEHAEASEDTENEAAGSEARDRGEAFDEVEMQELLTRKRGEQRRKHGARLDGGERKGKGGLMTKVTELRKSLSRSNDFVAVQMETEEEEVHSDWEVQMLAEELSKSEMVEMEEMRKLEDDVNTLKEVVCKSNLTRFTTSELDMLETILEAKDQRISEIASSSCFDIAGHKGKHTESDGEREEGRQCLRYRLGQTFSFDSHDMDARRRSQRKSIPLRKQKSTTCQERQGLGNLLHTSTFLRSRVLEDTERKTNQSKNGSLPLLASRVRNRSLQTSLPSLTSRGRYEGAISVSSSDEASHESCDSVAESLTQTTGAASRVTSLNSFIKAVGQKVRHAVAGDGQSFKEPLPTISRMCDRKEVIPEEADDCRQGKKFEAPNSP